MPRTDVTIYGYFEDPLWPDPPGNATPDPAPVAAVGSVPSPTLDVVVGAVMDQDAEILVFTVVPEPSIAGIVSVVVELETPAVAITVGIDDPVGPVIDTTGGGAAPDVVVATSSVPSVAVGISGGGAVFGGNFGGTF